MAPGPGLKNFSIIIRVVNTGLSKVMCNMGHGTIAERKTRQRTGEGGSVCLGQGTTSSMTHYTPADQLIRQLIPLPPLNNRAGLGCSQYSEAMVPKCD
jgi:hypothetical protein